MRFGVGFTEFWVSQFRVTNFIRHVPALVLAGDLGPSQPHSGTLLADLRAFGNAFVQAALAPGSIALGPSILKQLELGTALAAGASSLQSWPGSNIIIIM